MKENEIYKEVNLRIRIAISKFENNMNTSEPWTHKHTNSEIRRRNLIKARDTLLNEGIIKD
jgi:hypothetical protein